MTLGHKVKALNAMNSSELWMTCSTLGCDLWALDAMNNSKMLIICTTRDPMSLNLLMLSTA